jgi:hypothetical protein
MKITHVYVRPDGTICAVIGEMPPDKHSEEWYKKYSESHNFGNPNADYERALESIKSSAVPFENKHEAWRLIVAHLNYKPIGEGMAKTDSFYPLELEVEIVTVMSPGWQPTYNNPDNIGCEQPSEPIEVARILTEEKEPQTIAEVFKDIPKGQFDKPFTGGSGCDHDFISKFGYLECQKCGAMEEIESDPPIHPHHAAPTIATYSRTRFPGDQHEIMNDLWNCLVEEGIEKSLEKFTVIKPFKKYTVFTDETPSIALPYTTNISEPVVESQEQLTPRIAKLILKIRDANGVFPEEYVLAAMREACELTWDASEQHEREDQQCPIQIKAHNKKEFIDKLFPEKL